MGLTWRGGPRTFPNALHRAESGYANWIDNHGYAAGALSFRNVLASELPALAAKVVKAADVPAHMHASSRKATAEERAEELRRRFDAIRRRYRI